MCHINFITVSASRCVTRGTLLPKRMRYILEWRICTMCKRGEHIPDYVGEGYDDRLHPVNRTFRPAVSSDQPILQWKARPVSTPTLPNTTPAFAEIRFPRARNFTWTSLPPSANCNAFLKLVASQAVYFSPSTRLIWTRIIASLEQGVLEKKRKEKVSLRGSLMYLFRRHQSVALVSSFLCNSYSEVCNKFVVFLRRCYARGMVFSLLEFGLWSSFLWCFFWWGSKQSDTCLLWGYLLGLNFCGRQHFPLSLR